MASQAIQISQAMEKVIDIFLFLRNRRWIVLTSQNIYTFKEEKKYTDPTETIALKDCSSIKNAIDETKKENSFVLNWD